MNNSTNGEKFTEMLNKVLSNTNNQDAITHQRSLVRWAFESGWIAGRQDLFKSAASLLEVKEREQVDSVILGEEKDDRIPF